MPDDAAPVRSSGVSTAPDAPASPKAPDFPADTRVLALRPEDFARGEGESTQILSLSNPHHSVLHVRRHRRPRLLHVHPHPHGLLLAGAERDLSGCHAEPWGRR